MSLHTDKVLLARIAAARADLLCVSESKSREVLSALEKHLPADIRLGRCLAEIQKSSWDSLRVDRKLAALSLEIEEGIAPANYAEELLRVMDSAQGSDLLGVSPATISSWKSGKQPSAHNIKKIKLVLEVWRKRGPDWFEEEVDGQTRKSLLSSWKKGEAPAGLDFSKATF